MNHEIWSHREETPGHYSISKKLLCVQKSAFGYCTKVVNELIPLIFQRFALYGLIKATVRVTEMNMIFMNFTMVAMNILN